jgi:hypothetical protein
LCPVIQMVCPRVVERSFVLRQDTPQNPDFTLKVVY